MATSNNPLAPDATTDIDGPEVWAPIEPLTDLTDGVPVEEEEDAELEDEDEAVDEDNPL
jgi:hypothetical protein